MPFLTKNVLGVFVVEDGEIIEKREFPREPEKIVEKLEKSEEEEEIREEYQIEQKQMDAVELGKKAGIIESKKELYELQRQVAQEYTKKNLKKAQSKDQLLVQASRALDDLDKVNNKLIERLRPWYKLHFPEFEDKLENHQKFAELVAENPERGEIPGFKSLAEGSTGMELDEKDKEIIKKLAEKTAENHELRKKVENYVKHLAEQIAPNLSAVLGKVLTGRMVALAGSLEKLAKMPSSTIQVLGAEKALFRHMKGKGSAPKHGILYMHPKVQKAPDGERGKISRYIANKASIAARLDFYGGDYKGKSLKHEIEDKFEELGG
ncbi:MAG: hypothetical protein MUP58_02695 [Candidatus Nanohaloarchaeota archaeon QJJ-9]|nr:hypothetical protein [Candidatus Nanohaloarchaeota archaeon QJJ-9]